MAMSLVGGTAKRVYVTDKVGCGIEVYRSGCVVVWKIAASFSVAAAWGSRTLATGLPPALLQARVPLAMQDHANQGAVAFVEAYGQLIAESKANDLSGSGWIFASGAYISAQ